MEKKNSAIENVVIKGIKHEDIVDKLSKSLILLKETHAIIQDAMPVKKKEDLAYPMSYHETMFEVEAKHMDLVVGISKAIGFLVAGDLADMSV